MTQRLWSFSTAVCRTRQRELFSVSGFVEVVMRVSNCAVESFGIEPRDKLPCVGTHRAVFRLQIHPPDCDAFFNSPVGYRAQYCIAVEQGELCNRQIIDALTPKCLAFGNGKWPSHFPEHLVAASLAGHDAKIWIEEKALAGLEGAHIQFAPWLAKAAAVSTGSSADMAARSKAEAGILAPVGTHLELKGAWIWRDGTECRDPQKASRGKDIHDYGFS